MKISRKQIDIAGSGTFDVPDALEFGHLPDDPNVPGKQSLFLSPRYEPSNITSNATVLQIQEAIRTAEAGDTQQLFRFYRDVLLGDDHIAGDFNTRKLAVISQPMAVLPCDKKNPDDVALAKAMLRAIADCENWNDGVEALMGSNAIWPASILERLYKPGGDPRPGEPKLNYTLKKFIPVNPQLICYQWAYMMGGVGLGTGSAIQVGNVGLPGQGGVMPRSKRDDVRNGNEFSTGTSPWYTIDLEVWEPYIKLWPIDEAGRIIYDVTHAEYLDPKRHVIHRGHDLKEFRDNWGGPGRSLLQWWLLRNLGRQWFSRGMERYGNPWPIGYTDAKDPQAVALLRQAFDMAKQIGGLIVDESSKVELEQAMSEGMAAGYETFLNRCNEAISYRITGLKESKKPAGLNSGEGQMQQTVREDVRVMDQIRLGETCNRQILVPFRDLNNLKGNAKFVWGGLSDADAGTFSDLLLTMKQAGFTLAGDSLPTVEERTGLSWVITPTPAPAGAGGAGGAENPKVTTFAADARPHWLMSAQTPGAPNPVSDLPDQFSTELAKAFRGVNAPVAKILRDSTSPEDFLAKLKLFYADYKPDRIVAIAQDALQLASAIGAKMGTGDSPAVKK